MMVCHSPVLLIRIARRCIALFLRFHTCEIRVLLLSQRGFRRRACSPTNKGAQSSRGIGRQDCVLASRPPRAKERKKSNFAWNFVGNGWRPTVRNHRYEPTTALAPEEEDSPYATLLHPPWRGSARSEDRARGGRPFGGGEGKTEGKGDQFCRRLSCGANLAIFGRKTCRCVEMQGCSK